MAEYILFQRRSCGCSFHGTDIIIDDGGASGMKVKKNNFFGGNAPAINDEWSAWYNEDETGCYQLSFKSCGNNCENVPEVELPLQANLSTSNTAFACGDGTSQDEKRAACCTTTLGCDEGNCVEGHKNLNSDNQELPLCTNEGSSCGDPHITTFFKEKYEM